MAVPLNTSSSSERALRALERERKEESDGRAAAWGVVWTLFGFKLGTVAIIWYAAAGSREANEMLLATTWFWFVIPIIALSGTAAYRWRLVKQRRRREMLRAAEWMESHPADATGMSDEDIRLLIHPDPRDRRPSL
jgi:hypothetical protein